MSLNIKIEKLCEYLVNFGLLKVDDLISFLKMNSQISENNYNDKEQLILTLFSYLASISKNEQQLYDISKNIIESFLSKQAIIGKLTKKVSTEINENELDKNNQLLRSANNFRKFNIFPIKKGKSTQKNNLNNMDNFYFEEGKEFTFSPKINRPKSNRIRNRSNNFPYRYDIDYDENIFNKNNKIKNKNLYNDNKINNEISNQIDKLYDYYSKQNIGKNYNSPNYNIFNIRDFCQKEENHVKRVEDKITKLTLNQLKELEQACTFSPKIHDIPDYIIKNKIRMGSIYDNNYYNMNNIRYINGLPYQNDQIQNMKNKINKIIDEYAMDYYDIPLNNTKKNKKASLSNSKEISFGGSLSDKNNIQIKANFSFSDKKKEENDMKLLNDLQKRFRIPMDKTVKNNANGEPTQKRNSTNSKSKHKNSINKDKKSEEDKSKTSSNKPNGDKESKNSVSNTSQKKEIEKSETNDINNKEQIEKNDTIEDNNNSSNKTDNNNEKNITSSNKTDNDKSKKNSIKTDNDKSKKNSIKTDNDKSKKNSIKTDNDKSKKSSIKTDNNNEKNNISSNKTDNDKSKKNSIITDNDKSKKNSIITDNDKRKNNSITTDNNNKKNNKR
jgi:CCR4-NOT transcription complex subunit 4